MKLSSLNYGLDSVVQGYLPMADNVYPKQKSLPPNGRAITDHVALLYPASLSQQLLEAFAKPALASSDLYQPVVNQQVFTGLLMQLESAAEGSVSSLAFTLLKQLQQDSDYLLANHRNLLYV